MASQYEYLLESIEQLEEGIEQLEEELNDFIAEVKSARVCPLCWRLELPPGNHKCEGEREDAPSLMRMFEESRAVSSSG